MTLGHGIPHYPDDGCHAAPSCLSCPLPQCVYDTYQGRLADRAQRNEAIRRDRARGMQQAELMEKYRVPRRTLYRALSGPQPYESGSPDAPPESVRPKSRYKPGLPAWGGYA